MSIPPSPFRDLQKLYRIFLYSHIGSVIISVLIVSLGLMKPFAAVTLDRLLQVIAVLYSFLAVIVGLQLFRRRVNAIRENNQSVRDKLSQFRSGCIVQWALLTGAGFFCSISYVITGNWAFPLLAIMLMAIFGGLNPFRQKVMLQLRLSEQDVAGM
jgi:amino acid permease